ERDFHSRRLGIICHGALDDLLTVVNALNDEQQGDYRFAATYFLRNWMGRHAENDFKLYRALHDKDYTDVQSKTVLGLLHGFSEEDLASPETYEVLLAYLRHEKLAVRELAHFYLRFLIKEGAQIGYDPADETAQREAGAAAYR